MNSTLKSVHAYQDNTGNWFMRLRYEVENPDGVHEIIIPKLSFPIGLLRYPSIDVDWDPYSGDAVCLVHLQNESLFVNNGDCRSHGKKYRDVPFVDSLIKPAQSEVKEMTLEEIEKELGHPVKIIS